MLLMTESGLILPEKESDEFDLTQAFTDVLVDSGLMPRGTNTEGDVITQTIDGRSLNDIWREFQRSLDFWNNNRTALVNALTFAVQQPIEDVPQITGDDFEEASEFGDICGTSSIGC